MIKNILNLCLLILTLFSAKAQDQRTKNNSVFIELLGAAGHYSINYDKSLPIQNNFGIRMGIGFSPSLIGGHSSPRFPIQVKVYKKFKKHTWETGLAFTPYLSDNPHIGFSEKLKDPTLALFAQLGYKRSILKDKYYWGVTLTPLLFDERDWDVYPWAALQFGYQF